MIKFLKTLFAKLVEKQKKKVKKVAVDKLVEVLPDATVTKIKDGFYKIESTAELTPEQLMDIIKKQVRGD